MTGEINSDFYCHYYADGYCNLMGNNRLCNSEGCPQLRHKWPTPEQYKQENQGKEWPDDGAVYYCITKSSSREDAPGRWNTSEHSIMKKIHGFDKALDLKREYIIVCACTPWGRPADNWRPE